MPVRAALAILLIATPAAADTFGGFSGVDKPYLVNQDKVCKPLVVKAGAATGAPECQKAGADVIAKLSIKDPLPQRGDKAVFAASAEGRTITVTRKQTGDKVVTWTTMDPVAKIVEVYASQYEDRIAVAYTSRRMGRDVTDVVAFDLLKPGAANTPDPNATTTQQPTTAPPEDPKLTKAVEAARKAAKAKQADAWKAVLALDADHSEAKFRLAALAAAKQPADAIAQLEALAKSTRSDAIEWLVEARFDPAFASVRADAKFRAAAGLDRKPASLYERLMGFGGQWEQNGTSCDKPEVKLVLKRDRSLALRVKTRCQGQVYDTPFKGTWRIDGSKVVLGFPTKGKVTQDDESQCAFEASGDEDALRCNLGRDLDFVVLPARR